MDSVVKMIDLTLSKKQTKSTKAFEIIIKYILDELFRFMNALAPPTTLRIIVPFISGLRGALSRRGNFIIFPLRLKLFVSLADF
jgi:hypothetical protein